MLNFYCRTSSSGICGLFSVGKLRVTSLSGVRLLSITLSKFNLYIYLFIYYFLYRINLKNEACKDISPLLLQNNATGKYIEKDL